MATKFLENCEFRFFELSFRDLHMHSFYYKSIIEIEKLVLGHVTPMTFAMVISLKNNVLNTKHCNFSWIYYATNLYQHMIKN